MTLLDVAPVPALGTFEALIAAACCFAVVLVPTAVFVAVALRRRAASEAPPS